MAVTSSSDRSKRMGRSAAAARKKSTSSGRTAGPNPKVDNRVQRQKTSTARVTQGSNGKPSGSGSARVTTGRGQSSQAADARKWQRMNQSSSAKAGKAAEAAPRKPAPGTGDVVKRAIEGGQKAKAKAGAQKAMANMASKLKAAAAKRTAAGGLKGGLKAAAVAEGLTARNTASGTLRGKPTGPSQGPSVPKRLTQGGIDKNTFDDAFRNARKAGQKEFTWRGKRYNTKMK